MDKLCILDFSDKEHKYVFDIVPCEKFKLKKSNQERVSGLYVPTFKRKHDDEKPRNII